MRGLDSNQAALRRLARRVRLALQATFCIAIACIAIVLTGCSSTSTDRSVGGASLPRPEASPAGTSLVVATPTASYVPPTPIPVRTFPPSQCSPPCWQGITPGKTTVDEAVRILGEPDRRRDRLQTDGKTTIGHVWGEIVTTRKWPQPSQYEQVVLIYEDGIVRSIIITEPEGRETMAGVATRQGTPEYVLTSALHMEAPYWHAALIYPSKGMTFESDYNFKEAYCGDGIPPISKRDPILTVRYYEPTTIAEVVVNRYSQGGSAAYGKRVDWSEVPD